MKSYTSPAKVNLCLLVKGRRADGYHEIETLMQAVNLVDTLLFTPITQGIEVLADTPEVPDGEANIVWRAANLLLAKTGYRGGIRVEIQKRIPVAAGLGGGSSNAATTLLALNDLFSLNINKRDLLSWAISLGADVPFFIFGKTAWARGIGEKLVAATEMPKLHYLIINPGFPLSTRDVYNGLKIALTNKTNDYSAPAPLRGGTEEAESLAGLLVNDLESVSLSMYPQIGEIKRRLLISGAHGALMSGSGPSVFGVFASAAAAHSAAGKIAMEAEWRAFVATGLNNW